MPEEVKSDAACEHAELGHVPMDDRVFCLSCGRRWGPGSMGQGPETPTKATWNELARRVEYLERELDEALRQRDAIEDKLKAKGEKCSELARREGRWMKEAHKWKKRARACERRGVVQGELLTGDVIVPTWGDEYLERKPLPSTAQAPPSQPPLREQHAEQVAEQLARTVVQDRVRAYLEAHVEPKASSPCPSAKSGEHTWLSDPPNLERCSACDLQRPALVSGRAACERCRWATLHEDPAPYGEFLLCRLQAPDPRSGTWASVRRSDWCGRFEHRATAGLEPMPPAKVTP